MDELAVLQTQSEQLLNQLLFVTSEPEYLRIQDELKKVNLKIAVIEGQGRAKNKEAEEAALKARLENQQGRIARVEEAKKKRTEIAKRLFKDLEKLYEDWMEGYETMAAVDGDFQDASIEARELDLEPPEGFPRTFAFNFPIVEDIQQMFQQYAQHAGELKTAKKQGKTVLNLKPDWETFSTIGYLRVGDDGKPWKQSDSSDDGAQLVSAVFTGGEPV